MEIIFIRKSDFSIDNSKKSSSFLAREIALKGVFFLYGEKCEIENSSKVPKFKNSDIEFSISHSKDVVAVLFAKKSKTPIGLDVEYMKERNFLELAEYQGFCGIFDKISFYKAWTFYEANFKAKDFYTLKNALNFVIDNYMFTFLPGIKSRLKIYELKIPSDKTAPSELISLKLTKDNKVKEITVEAQEINTAVAELSSPDSLKTQ